MIALQKYAVSRTTTVGLTESINGRLASDIRSQIVTGKNEVNICYVSTCGDSVNVTNPSVNSYTSNVNS
jgi:ribosomal protein L13